MWYKRNGNQIVLRIDKGEEIISTLLSLCEQENIRTASVNGIGATNNAVIGVLDTKTKEYHKKQLSSDMEITALVGNLTQKDGKPYVHLHATLANIENVFAGHLNSAVVSATAELFIQLFDIEIQRFFDSDTGLNLMN